MALQSRAGLHAAIADWLNRTDMTDVIPDLVALVEARMRRDKRIRKLVVSTLSVDAAEEALPSDFRSMESLRHNGPTYWGELDNVDPGDLSDVRALYGTSTSYPRAYAVEDQATLHLAPVPDTTYSLVMSYWAGFDALSDTNLSNWILENHPDLYLYGALAESAPYIKDDARVTVWEGRYQTAAEELRRNISDGQYGGSLVRRQPIVI